MRAFTLGLFVAAVCGCDHGLDPVPAGPTGIAGRITFEGDWPAEVAEVAVVVYPEQPQTVSDFGSLAGWDTDVPLGASSYPYSIELQGAGDYGWIVVVWRPPDQLWNFTSLLECYQSQGSVSAVSVVRGQTTEDVDIVVDFGVISSPIPMSEWACTRDLPAEIIDMAGG